MTRVFHTAGLIWLASAALVLGLELSPMICALSGVVVLGILATGGNKLPRRFLVCAFAFCACVLSVAAYRAVIIAPSEPYLGTAQRITGTVTDQTAFQNYRRLTIRTSKDLPWGLRNVIIQAVDFNALDVDTGDVVNCQIELENNPERRNKLYSENIRFSGRLTDARKTGSAKPLAVRLAVWRDTMSRGITRNLTGEEGAVLSAMLFGRTEQLSPELRRDYSRAGISHLLAVSGLHLAVLVMLLTGFLRFMKVSPRQISLCTIAAVLLFMGLTGFSQSVTRAGIMLLLLTAAQLIGRDADARNSLGLAAILILLQNPYAVFSVSFQLSYLAALGILAFTKPLAEWYSLRVWKISLPELKKRSRWRYGILNGLSVSVCANLLTLPVVCREFGYVSLVSPMTNLMIAALVPVALGSGMLCGLAGLFSELRLPGRIFGLVGGVVIKCINRICRWWSEQMFSALPVTERYLFVWIVVCVIIGVLLWHLRAQAAVKRYAACLAVISLLAGAFSQKVTARNAVWFAADEYGKSVAVAYGKQGAVIGAPDSERAAQNLAAFFADRGVTGITLLVAKKDAQLNQNPTVSLAKMLPVEAAVALDESYGFVSVLFGNVRVSANGKDADSVLLEIGGLRIAKEFKQLALPAHILINGRNELVLDPRLHVAVQDGYYGGNVFSVRLPKEPLVEPGSGFYTLE